MATRHSLPYYAPVESLPAPLPTMDEILDCEHFIGTSFPQYKQVRIRKHFYVKYGTNFLSLQEGENMLFIRESTSIPVPTVYALFEERGFKVLILEYIEGRDLRECWGSLPIVGKETFTRQIRRYLQEMRAIPSPGYYGGIWKQDIRDPLLMQEMDIGRVIPPGLGKSYQTEKEWCEMMLRVAEDYSPIENPYNLEWARYKFHATLQEGHPPVFSNNCLAIRHMYRIRNDGVVVITDWNYAGWYPSYWVYYYASQYVVFRDDWTEWLRDIFKGMEYVAEECVMESFYSWMQYCGLTVFDDRDRYEPK